MGQKISQQRYLIIFSYEDISTPENIKKALLVNDDACYGKFIFKKSGDYIAYISERDNTAIEVMIFIDTGQSERQHKCETIEELAQYIYNKAEKGNFLFYQKMDHNTLVDYAARYIAILQEYQEIYYPTGNFTPKPFERWSKEQIAEYWAPDSKLREICRSMLSQLCKYADEAKEKLEVYCKEGKIPRMDWPVRLAELTELLIQARNVEKRQQEEKMMIDTICKLSEQGFATPADLFDYQKLTYDELKNTLQEARRKQQIYIENVNRVGARLQLLAAEEVPAEAPEGS